MKKGFLYLVTGTTGDHCFNMGDLIECKDSEPSIGVVWNDKEQVSEVGFRAENEEEHWWISPRDVVEIGEI